MAALLTPAAQFSVAGCFPSAAAALDGLRASGARVALVELLLPDGCGIRCARQLRQAVPGLAAILVSHSAERELAPYAVAAGVHHWLIEAVSREQWLTTLQFGFCAEAQRACLPPLGPPAPVTGGASLNNNEQEVMKALARGMMHKEIAARLGWSDAREKRIQHSAYEKLNAHTRTDALNRWRRINAPPTAPAQ
jgi:two-component system response regulator DesR